MFSAKPDDAGFQPVKQAITSRRYDAGGHDGEPLYVTPVTINTGWLQSFPKSALS